MVVVANGPWPKHVSPARVSELASETLCPENDNRMTAKAVLICRPNSHPFQERSLTLDQPVKIGRSVARARPAPNNAIFDCKVLSRNHALLWYENGKFYLQDTKSSNGTFVNNQRLSKGSEESPPREVCSADIVQFGVDVMENSRKVTHGCIVATLKLYLPDGKEAKASPSTSVMSSVGMVPLEDLYQLNQYLQEALQREQLLENKLATLQRLVGSMRQASDEGWKALIDEDRLLSRVEILENQLQAYSKNFADDKLREELRKLMDDKEQYQSAAKESVRKVLQEKLDAIQKLQDLERALSNSEDECNVLRYLCEKSQGDTKDLAQKYKIQQQEVEELTAKIDENEKEETDFFLRLDMERQELQGKLKQLLEAGHSIPELGDSIPPKQTDDDLQQRLNAVQVHLHELQNKSLHSKLNEMNDVKQSDNKDDFIAKNNDEAPENMKEGLKYSHEEVDKLKHRLELTLEEQRDAYGLIEILQRQLEEFTLQQELKNNTANHLQERITNLEFQLEDAQDKEAMDEEVQSNKAPIIDGDKTDSSSKIRAELVELEELLEEARTGKQTAEEQVLQARSQLKEVQSKSEKAAEEVTTIRQQLQQIACMDRGNRYSMLHLEQQMVNLVSTTQNMEAQMGQLQNRLQEEHQHNKKQADEIENLRKQLVDSQQNAKQCKNEAEKMKDTVRSLKKDLESKRLQTGSVVLEDIRKEEELSRCRQECESLQSWISVMENEMRTLKSDHSKLEEENRTLRNVKVDFETLKSKVRDDSFDNTTHSEFNGSDESKTQSPTTPHDIIQLKQLYVSCQQRKAELAKDLENLQQENKRLSNQSNAVPLQLLFLFALLGVVFAWIFFIFYHSP